MSRTFVVVAVTALLAFAAPASAEVADTVLGADGEVFRLHVGELAKIGPGEVSRDAVALALQITDEAGESRRLLVPGTENGAVETSPALTLDKATNTVYAVWEARRTIHSTLNLAWYDGETWSDVVEFSGDAFSTKVRPQLIVTTEEFFVLDAGGEPVERVRTILHLLWWDEGTEEQALYTPLIIDQGEFIHFNPIFALSDFLPSDLAASETEPTAALREAPTLAPGDDATTVVASFVDGSTGRLATVEIGVVPGGLVHVADRARAQIIEIGRTGASLATIADKARAQIIEIGREVMDTGVARYIADRARAQIIEIGREGVGLSSIADRARAQIIEIGATLGRGATGLQQVTATSIMEVESTDRAGNETLHDFRFASLSHHEAPGTPERPLGIVASPDGSELVVAWDTDGAVRYRESTADGWSEVRTLRLSEEMSRDAAHEVLERRVRGER